MDVSAVGGVGNLNRIGGGQGAETAPGQLAKSAVSAAREAGIELPPNAQGFAASSIARGADPAAVFAAAAAEETPGIPRDPAPDVTAGTGGAPDAPETGTGNDVAPAGVESAGPGGVEDPDPVAEAREAELSAAETPNDGTGLARTGEGEAAEPEATTAQEAAREGTDSRTAPENEPRVASAEAMSEFASEGTVQTQYQAAAALISTVTVEERGEEAGLNRTL